MLYWTAKCIVNFRNSDWFNRGLINAKLYVYTEKYILIAQQHKVCSIKVKLIVLPNI